MKSSNATYTGFEFEVDGYPALAIINADLKKLPLEENWPYSVFVQLVPDTFNENGHPEGEEYDFLNEIERVAIDYLEEQTETVHVGHTTIYRAREIIFYTNDKEAVEAFFESYLPQVEREAYFDVEYDPEWKNVSAFYELI